MLKRIIKNILKVEIKVFVFFAVMQILRMIMMGEKYYFDSWFTCRQWIVIVVLIAVMAVIQQLLKEKT